MLVNWVIGVFVALLTIYLLIVLWMYVNQSRRIFRPLRPLMATPADHGLEYEDVEFLASDGIRLHGWFIPRQGADHVVLFLHGNARNISHYITTAALYHELGYHILLFDYRGYGRSAGRPDEAGVYLDAEAAWRCLVEDRGYVPDRIAVHGRSLGAAIASRLATRHTPAALVIESTFTSMPDLAAELFPLLPARLLMSHRFPVRDNLRQVKCPVLVVHGREDELIPYRHGLALYEAANEPRELLDIEGRHFDGYLASGRHYLEGLSGFFRRHLG